MSVSRGASPFSLLVPRSSNSPAVIDAHLPVWDLGRAAYPWLGPHLAPIDVSLGIEDVRPGRRPGDPGVARRPLLDIFGPKRLMLGSDWPISVLAGGYGMSCPKSWPSSTPPTATPSVVALPRRSTIWPPNPAERGDLVRFARLGSAGEEIPAVRGEEGWLDLRSITRDLDGDFLGGDGVARARSKLHSGQLPRLEDVEGLRVGPPIARPGKIVCIGLNYRDHAEEINVAIPAEPVIFLKDARTIVGPYDMVRIPRGSTKTDWEVELGVVIGRTARYLESSDVAADHIAGYTISHDVSEREFQLERGGQWDKGKSCETFNPLGPWLVTADEVPEPQALQMRLDVNGVRRQDGSTANMIFPVSYLIWYVSQFMVLYPGDLLNTGTPAGVALGLPGQPYLRTGDVVELHIDGLGGARQEIGAA